MKKFPIALLLALLVSRAPTAQAGPVTMFDQVHLILKAGDRVTVRLDDGTHVRGTVTGASAHSLALLVREREVMLRETEIRRISRRRRDRVTDGALRGVGAAAVPALIGAGFVAGAPKSEGGGRVKAIAVVLEYCGIGAAMGAAIDAVIVRRDIVYERAEP